MSQENMLQQQLQHYMNQFLTSAPNANEMRKKKIAPTIKQLLDVPQAIETIANDPDYQNALI